ncbi:MAG: HAMP domain-containing sensor histidine kinase [Bacteroidota bacterium]
MKNQKYESRAKQNAHLIYELNDQIQHHDSDFKQFSHIVSHYLRSPIVKIKSIMLHLRGESVTADPTFDQSLIENAFNEAEKVDAVLHDLNSILAIHHAEQIKKYVSFKKKLSDVTHVLDTEIKESKASILVDLNSPRGVFSVPEYVRSILLKLISNAIKYRSAERNLIIGVKSYEEGAYTVLLIKDNGLGIDLSKYRSKIFGLYNRFHTHVEGKGTGLHFLKARTESIGGKIEIESEVNAGTIFKIYFPKYIG